MRISGKYRELFNYLKNNGSFPDGVDTVVITGGRGSGKSFPISSFISLVLAVFAGIKVLFSRYTMTSAGSSIVPEFQEKIDINGFEAVMRPVSRDGKKIIEADNSSEILFRGIKTSSGNQTAALKSLKDIAIWIVDEAEELIYESEFDKIQLSIRSNKFKNLTILILNPTHKNHWIYRRFFKETGVVAGFNGVVDDVMYIHTTFLDNILNLPKNIIKAYRKLRFKDLKKFLHVVMGGWLDQKEGLVYKHNWKIVNDRPKNIRLLGFGLDFGFTNDPTAFVGVWEVLDKTDTIYVETLFQETSMHNSDISVAIKSTNEWQRNSKLYIVADSAAPEKIDRLKIKYRLKVIAADKGQNSVLQGIDKVKDFTVLSKVGNPISEEQAEYSFNEDMKIEGKYENNPAKGNDHSLDAFRYFATKQGVSKMLR